MNEKIKWGELSAFYYDKPIAFVEDIILREGQFVTDQQKQALESVINHKRTTVKSGHGTGKSTTQAWLIIWWMFTRPNCRIPCTAPTGHQLNDILWPEVKKWYNQSRLFPFKFFEWTKTRFSLTAPEYKETWFATPVSVTNPDNLQGFHEDEVLFVVDEASGMPEEVTDVIEGALTKGGCKLAQFGNPTRVSGMFYDSFHKYRKLYNCITFSSEDSPLVTEDYVKGIADKYGVNSDPYRVRVKGEFPAQEVDTIIPRDLLESAAGKPDYKKIMNLQDPTVYMGVDVAREGDDSSQIYARVGNQVIEHEESNEPDTMYIAKKAARIAMRYNEHSKIVINVDLTGIGAGVVDKLNELRLKNVEVRGIHNNQTAKLDSEYADAITEMFYELKERLKTGSVVIPFDDELILQLSSRKYEFDSKGRFVIESKKKYKKRLGGSPDKGDALLLCFYQSNSKQLRAVNRPF